MVLLEKLWDDVLAARHPDRGLDKLKKLQTNLATTPGIIFLPKHYVMFFFSIYMNHEDSKRYVTLCNNILLVCSCT